MVRTEDQGPKRLGSLLHYSSTPTLRLLLGGSLALPIIASPSLIKPIYLTAALVPAHEIPTELSFVRGTPTRRPYLPPGLSP